MHELCARLFVRTSDELAERTIDCDEDAVTFVEFEPTDECAVGPTCKTLLAPFGEYMPTPFSTL